MLYFWLTVFPALVVFLGRLPATIRRVRAQREALRPVRPLARAEHFPCIMNTIGAAITEFFLLGLLTLAVFVVSLAAFGMFGQAPDLSTGVRHLSMGALFLIAALVAITGLLLIGGAFLRMLLMFSTFFTAVAMMVQSSAGDQAPAILLFALLAVGLPTLFVFVLRMFR